MSLGWVKVQMNRHERRAAGRNSPKTSPNSGATTPDALLGSALLRQGRIEEALNAFTKAVQITPDDAGLGWAIGKTKPDFVGKRSLQRPSMSAADRKQLVGLFTADPQVVLDEGSQVMQGPGTQPPVRPIGHVTSSYHSAVLGRSIALALVSGGRARMGEMLYVPTGNGDIAVKVTSPVFYDPEGARLNG